MWIIFLEGYGYRELVGVFSDAAAVASALTLKNEPVADADGEWRCDSLGCWYSGVLCQLNKVVSYTVAEWDWED